MRTRVASTLRMLVRIFRISADRARWRQSFRQSLQSVARLFDYGRARAHACLIISYGPLPQFHQREDRDEITRRTCAGIGGNAHPRLLSDVSGKKGLFPTERPCLPRSGTTLPRVAGTGDLARSMLQTAALSRPLLRLSSAENERGLVRAIHSRSYPPCGVQRVRTPIWSLGLSGQFLRQRQSQGFSSRPAGSISREFDGGPGLLHDCLCPGHRHPVQVRCGTTVGNTWQIKGSLQLSRTSVSFLATTTSRSALAFRPTGWRRNGRASGRTRSHERAD